MAFWLEAQKMVKASEEERFLMEIPGKTKAMAILFWCLYGQCSDSSGSKHPQFIFLPHYLLSLAT